METEKEGSTPRAGDEVTVHYKILRRDGSVVRDTKAEGKPLDFRVGLSQVVKGWDEAASLMSAGEKAVIQVPPSLAAKPSPTGMITPGDTLFLEMEILSIQLRPELEVVYHSQKEGSNPQKGQVVVYQYTGLIKDSARVFESNFQDLSPAWLIMGEQGRTIFGLQIAMEQMTVGDSMYVHVPSDLAFGRGGYMRGKVYPNTDLSFSIKILDIKEPGQYTPLDLTGAEPIRTPSGITVLKANSTNGEQPIKDSCFVKIHWTVYSADGKGMLTSTSVSDVPLALPFSEVGFPRGVVEGLSLLRVGEKARLRVPPGLAWGINGVPGKLSPNTDVMVDVELLEILPIGDL